MAREIGLQWYRFSVAESGSLRALRLWLSQPELRFFRFFCHDTVQDILTQLSKHPWMFPAQTATARSQNN
jgi:hypothetical protein